MVLTSLVNLIILLDQVFLVDQLFLEDQLLFLVDLMTCRYHWDDLIPHGLDVFKRPVFGASHYVCY